MGGGVERVWCWRLSWVEIISADVVDNQAGCGMIAKLALSLVSLRLHAWSNSTCVHKSGIR